LLGLERTCWGNHFGLFALKEKEVKGRKKERNNGEGI
jgi:hypothetical protein